MLIEEVDFNHELKSNLHDDTKKENQYAESCKPKYPANITSGVASCENDASQHIKEFVDSKRRSILPLSIFSIECQAEVLEFVCSLCSGVFINPISISCGHIFCDYCIKAKLKEDNSCPICRKQIKVNTLYPVMSIEAILSKKIVKCQSDQCNWTGRLAELWKHIDSDCKFKAYYCSNVGCFYSCLKSDLIVHLENCNYRLTVCDKCEEMVCVSQLEMHNLDVCPKVVINCPKGCKEQVLRANLLAHYTECLESDATCSLITLGCTFRGKKRELENHITSSFDNHFLLMYSQKLNTSNIFAKYLKRVDELFNPPQIIVPNTIPIIHQQTLKRKRGRPPKNANAVQVIREEANQAIRNQLIPVEESQSFGKIGLVENNSSTLVSAHKTAVPMNLGIKKNGNSFDCLTSQ